MEEYLCTLLSLIQERAQSSVYHNSLTLITILSVLPDAILCKQICVCGIPETYLGTVKPILT